MKIFWIIVAGTCIVVAAAFLFRGNIDAAFVVAVTGLVAWFLNYRTQIKASLASDDLEKDESKGKDPDED